MIKIKEISNDVYEVTFNVTKEFLDNLASIDILDVEKEVGVAIIREILQEYKKEK